MVFALVVLAALLAVAATLVVRPAWVLVALMVGLDVLWLLVNGPMEGEVLLRLTADHGVTVADLLVPATLPVLAYGALQQWLAASSRRRRH